MNADLQTTKAALNRMPTWEEDISLNHDSLEPFENLPAPNEMELMDFAIPDLLADPVFEGIDVGEFVKRDGYPIPASTDREGYNTNLDARFFMTGLSDYLKVRQTAQQYGVDVRSYLDFGCASGRVLRHFCAHSDVANLWGTDINGRHIRWLNEHLPSQLKLIHNHCLPHLGIADNSIDVLTAFSVFTHIDTFETAWLAELHRVLKPGGLCYLSVQNDATWNLLQQAGEEDYLLKRFRQLDDQFDQRLAGPIPAGRTCYRYTPLGPYRALVLHSDEYLKRTWGRYFDVLEIRSQAHGWMQSVFVGRKPDQSRSSRLEKTSRDQTQPAARSPYGVTSERIKPGDLSLCSSKLVGTSQPTLNQCTTTN